MNKPSDSTKKVLKHSRKYIIFKTIVSLIYRGIAMLTPILFSMAVDEVTNGKFKTGIIISIIGVIAVVAIFIGAIIFFVKSSSSPYDGKYELAAVEVQGQRVTIEELEKMSGMTFALELEINGKKGYMKMDYSYMKDEGNVDVEIDGNKIILNNGDEAVIFIYNEEDDTLVFEKDGNYLILEKVK